MNSKKLTNFTEKSIEFILTNFLGLTVLASVLIGFIVWGSVGKDWSEKKIAENFLDLTMLIAVGIGFLYAAFMHIFYGPLVAKSIGWVSNGFQKEIGCTNLAISVLGFLAFFKYNTKDFRLATTIVVSIFLITVGIYHFIDARNNNNFNPNNIGFISLQNFGIPLILITTMAIIYDI